MLDMLDDVPTLAAWAVAGALLLWLLWRFLRYCEAQTLADWGGPWRNRLAGLNVLFCRHYHHLRADPLPLPATGAMVVAANHLSGLDPLIMIAASPRPLRFLIAREEYQRFGFTWLFRLAGCIPVDRQHRPARALREALRALQAGDVVALFPHGHIHLDTAPPQRLKGGAVYLAQQAGCPILPLRVGGMRCQGHILAAVFVPSRAWVRAQPVLDCRGLSRDDCLQGLADAIQGGSEMVSQVFDS